MALTQSQREIAHLFRRAGFGATRADIATWAPQGRAAAVKFLVDYGTVDNSAVEAEVATLDVPNNTGRMTRAWLLRMSHTARPLEEKMTLFWHHLFATELGKVDNPLLMWQQNGLFRQNALPNWRSMLYAVSKDPAMLVYLDNALSRKEHPNENYARELMELYTLGQDVLYDEVDVRESARAFTGWTLDYRNKEIAAVIAERDAALRVAGLTDAQKRQISDSYQAKIYQVTPVYLFQPSFHDIGLKTFLDKQGNLDGSDIIDNIAGQDEAAGYICAKLYNWFVARGTVPDDMLNSLVSVYFDTKYDLKEVVRSILLSDYFYAADNYLVKIKSPTEYIAGLVRQLEMKTDGNSMVNATTALGQTLFQPPDPAGWPGQKNWINGNTIIGRTNQATTYSTRRPTATAVESFDPKPFITAANVSEAGPIVDLFADLLIDGSISTPEKNILIEYMHTDDSGNYKLFTLTDANIDKKVRGLVFLLLSSPAYTLA